MDVVSGDTGAGDIEPGIRIDIIGVRGKRGHKIGQGTGSLVTCRCAAHVPEWAWVLSMVAVPVVPVLTVNPARVPDSKLLATTVVPG